MVVRLSREGIRSAGVSLVIGAARERVWDALTDPALIVRYMPASTVESEWREGASIVWTFEFSDRPRDVEGLILRLEHGRVLDYEYTDPVTTSVHHVHIELVDEGGGTRLSLSERGLRTERERAHSEGGWRLALNNLKVLLE